MVRTGAMVLVAKVTALLAFRWLGGALAVGSAVSRALVLIFLAVGGEVERREEVVGVGEAGGEGIAVG